MNVDSLRAGDYIRSGSRRYLVLGRVERGVMYVEGDTPGICDKPVERRQIPVVPLPERPHLIDESTFPYLEEDDG